MDQASLALVHHEAIGVHPLPALVVGFGDHPANRHLAETALHDGREAATVVVTREKTTKPMI
jgi:hypothetical protein